MTWGFFTMPDSLPLCGDSASFSATKSLSTPWMEQEIKCLSMKNSYLIHPTNIYCVPSKLKWQLVVLTISSAPEWRCWQSDIWAKTWEDRNEFQKNMEEGYRRQFSKTEQINKGRHKNRKVKATSWTASHCLVK